MPGNSNPIYELFQCSRRPANESKIVKNPLPEGCSAVSGRASGGRRRAQHGGRAGAAGGGVSADEGRFAARAAPRRQRGRGLSDCHLGAFGRPGRHSRLVLLG